MSFKDKTFKERYKDEMWHHSEDHFERLWPYEWDRFGLDQDTSRIPTWQLSEFIRHAPDYVTQLGERCPPFFIEVQGTGKDRIHKFKHRKMDVLGKWNKEHTVVYWLWDDKLQQGTCISFNQVRMMVAKGQATQGVFDGHRKYWGLTVDQIVENSDWGALQGRLGVRVP